VVKRAGVAHRFRGWLQDRRKELADANLDHPRSRKPREPSARVGAVAAGKLAEPEKKVLPALSGDAGRMKGQPSDIGYGCLDDGRLPSVAVGRFPARTEEEARGLVAKTLAYERATKPGQWRRRLTILAGIPAYNPLVDRMVVVLPAPVCVFTAE